MQFFSLMRKENQKRYDWPIPIRKSRNPEFRIEKAGKSHLYAAVSIKQMNEDLATMYSTNAFVLLTLRLYLTGCPAAILSLVFNKCLCYYCSYILLLMWLIVVYTWSFIHPEITFPFQSLCCSNLGAGGSTGLPPILRTCLLFSVVYSRCGPITQWWAPVARGPGEEAVYITLYSPLLFCSVYIYTDSNIKATRSICIDTLALLSQQPVYSDLIYISLWSAYFPLRAVLHVQHLRIPFGAAAAETLYLKWVLSDYIPKIGNFVIVYIYIKPFHSLWISRKRFIRLAIVKSTRNKYPRVRVERHCENFVSGRWCPLRVFNIIVLFIPSTLHSSSCGLCNIWAISCPDWTPCRRYTHIIVLENQLPNQLEIYKKETITPYIYWIRLAVLKREIKSPSSFVYAQG